MPILTLDIDYPSIISIQFLSFIDFNTTSITITVIIYLFLNTNQIVVTQNQVFLSITFPHTFIRNLSFVILPPLITVKTFKVIS